MSRILIIEDERETAIPVKEALALENVEAVIAKDGYEGIELFKSSEFDLVLLDLKMPGLSGEEVLAQIRKLDPFVDVLVYTNYSDFIELKKLTNIGIQGYINKGPEADLSELIDKIMSNLAPITEEDLNKLIKATPDELFE